MGNDPSDSYHLGQRVRQGDETALRQLWLKHEDRLRRMVELRMDRRLLGRIDVSHVSAGRLRRSHKAF